MELKQLVRPLSDAVVEGDLGVDIKKIEYDSRQIEEGDLFVAIRGYRTDGHRFIDQALANGARAVALEDDRKLAGAAKVKVLNSRQALAILADQFYGHPSQRLRVIGITGTNGKTTVSHLAKEIFESSGVGAGLIGTINYQIGREVLPACRTTPESLDLHRLFTKIIQNGQEVAVVEVSSHSIVLERIYGIRFEIAAFTNLSRDHLDFHRTYEDYLAAKASLFERLHAATGGKAVVNIDDPAGGQIIRRTKVPVLTYGFSEKAMVRPLRFKVGWEGTELSVNAPAGQFDVRLSLKGIFNIENALAAISIALASGIDLPAIREGIGRVQGLPGRFERIDCGQDFFTIVDYAHTPAALEMLLKTVRQLASGRVILVFGCGGDRDRGKRPVMGRIATQMANLSFVTSDNPRSEHPDKIIEEIVSGIDDKNFQVMPDRKEAITSALEAAKTGDVVVIAGKGHEDYQIIGDQVIHFDDREVVREVLKEKGNGR